MVLDPLITNKITFSNAFCQEPGDDSDPSSHRKDQMEGKQTMKYFYFLWLCEI